MRGAFSPLHTRRSGIYTAWQSKIRIDVILAFTITFILLSSFPVSPADVKTNNEDNQSNFYSDVQNDTQNYSQLNPGEIELPSLPQLPIPRDLYVSTGDIQVTPNNPTEGDKIDITAIVHNKNRFPTYNLVVKLYDNQTEIYTYSTKLLYNESFTITTSTTVSRPGAHSITVKIDPDNKTMEKDKSNNIASIQLTVKTKNVYRVSISSDIENRTVTIGESVVYLIKVKNLGNVDDEIGLMFEYSNTTNATSGWTGVFSRNKVPISSGKNASINITITPPLNAKDGDALVIQVTAYSLSTPTAKDSIVLTTVAVKEESTEGTESFFLPGMESLLAVIAIGAVMLLLRRKK